MFQDFHKKMIISYKNIDFYNFVSEIVSHVETVNKFG